MIPTAIVTLRSLRSVVRPCLPAVALAIGGLTLAMVKERGSGRECYKKSIDEHIVVSCSIEIVFTTVFSLLKDLVSDDPDVSGPPLSF